MTAKIKISGHPLSESEIVRFESRFGITLPEEYRNFFLQHNGGEPSPDEFIVPGWKGEASAVSSFFSISGDKEAGLESEILSFKTRIPDSIIPIGTDPGVILFVLG